MQHNLYTRIMNASDAELDAIAKRYGVALPEEFVASDPRYAKAEYLCDKLDLAKADEFEDRHSAEAETFAASLELDKEARRIQDDYPDWSYERCLAAARRENPDLVELAFPSKGL
jgi:hypothetical protein